jgi:hypothetical protein
MRERNIVGGIHCYISEAPLEGKKGGGLIQPPPFLLPSGIGNSEKRTEREIGNILAYMNSKFQRGPCILGLLHIETTFL